MKQIIVLILLLIPFAVAQTGLVKAHLWPDIVRIEVEAATGFGHTPPGITAYPVAV